MEVASVVTSTAGVVPVAESIATMKFNYKPGFKVGMGANFDYDNWDAHAEYTWFHNTNSRSVSGTSGTAVATVFPWQFDVLTGGGVDVPYDSGKNTWNLKMDIVDLDLGRWYYVGTKLTWRPDFGVRGAFIRQTLTSTFTRDLDLTAAADVATSLFRSASWAVGPKAGLCTNWMLGYGFRFFGNAEADILFTRYSKVMVKQSHTDAALATVNSFNASEKTINTVRTHFDIDFGFGWGTYWDCNNWYTDVALGYEFQAFSGQNMFDFDAGITPNGNLYTQGLTATFSLMF
jgi:hypothetical protein